MSLLKLYIKIRQSLQPYWKPNPKWLEKKDVERKKSKGIKVKGTTKPTMVKLMEYKKPMDKCYKFKNKPKDDEIWYYRDKNRHQIMAKFQAGCGYRFKSEHRDDLERKKLKPLIYPIQNSPFDRTHLVPFGYHGLENDQILVVGWNSDQNRNEFSEFEQRQKVRKVPIYWITDIRRTTTGVRWRYIILNADTNEVLDVLKTSMNCEFKWK